MKAMILAAGLGTRLRPLTDTIPKALVEINGRTLLEITIERLKKFGVTEIIVNVHHHAGQIAGYLKSRQNFGIQIAISREDDLLLDTGGGLKKAAWFFLEGKSSEHFFLHNVDVLSTIDFKQMLESHKKSDALATLAVQQRASSRQLLFGQNNLLIGRRINNTDSFLAGATANTCHSERSEESAFSSISPLAFSGIHVISPRLLPLISESGAFSIIDTYLRLAASGEKIAAFRADNFYWRDLGRPEDLDQVWREINAGASPLP
ncbi:MAG: nucleotidyltransferase family protein [Acidobacteria bacterium]|nr:nucleotidyltransferase family protein [Acidobacteriota bacterium]MBS1865987.1 nucleotidyltransferase family protein [Acidobacteriota bacterium]